MSEIKVKKLPEGGYGIYTLDKKSKAEIQTGYIGPGLNVEAFLPEGAVIEK